MGWLSSVSLLYFSLLSFTGYFQNFWSWGAWFVATLGKASDKTLIEYDFTLPKSANVSSCFFVSRAISSFRWGSPFLEVCSRGILTCVFTCNSSHSSQEDFHIQLPVGGILCRLTEAPKRSGSRLTPDQSSVLLGPISGALRYFSLPPTNTTDRSQNRHHYSSAFDHLVSSCTPVPPVASVLCTRYILRLVLWKLLSRQRHRRQMQHCPPFLFLEVCGVGDKGSDSAQQHTLLHKENLLLSLSTLLYSRSQ